MDKDSELLEKVIVFLIVLVGAILVYTQYNLFNLLEGNYLVYISLVLILVLVGVVAWMFVEKPTHEIKHHEAHEHHLHAEHSHAEHHLHEHQQENHPHHSHEHHHIEAKPLTSIEKINYGLVAVVALLILFNQVQISQASALMGVKSGLTLKFSSTKTSLALTGDPVKDAMTVVIPTGTPFYGNEIGVSFENPVQSLEVIAQLDPAYGKKKIQLTPEEKERYIRIGTTPTITCEFCCGVKTAVNKNGGPACGCKHVWGMRGVMAYLIKYHPDLSDDEIKHEMMKWKGIFFPKQMVQRYIQQAQTGEYTPDIAALLLNIDESKLKSAKVSVAAQVGNQTSDNTVASIDDLPAQVGGC